MILLFFKPNSIFCLISAYIYKLLSSESEPGCVCLRMLTHPFQLLTRLALFLEFTYYCLMYTDAHQKYDITFSESGRTDEKIVRI